MNQGHFFCTAIYFTRLGALKWWFVTFFSIHFTRQGTLFTGLFGWSVFAFLPDKSNVNVRWWVSVSLAFLFSSQKLSCRGSNKLRRTSGFGHFSVFNLLCFLAGVFLHFYPRNKWNVNVRWWVSGFKKKSPVECVSSSKKTYFSLSFFQTKRHHFLS